MKSIFTVSNASNRAQPGRLASSLVLVIWIVTLLAEAGKFLVYLLPLGSHEIPTNIGSSLQMDDLAQIAVVLQIATLGAFIVLRAANRRIGWLMLAASFTLAIVNFTSEYSLHALLVVPQANLPMGLLAGWVQDLWPIAFMMLFSLPFLFPDGNLPSRRWQAIFWFHTAAWSLFIIVFAFGQRPLTNVFLEFETRLSNPFGIIPGSTMLYDTAFVALVAFSIVMGAASTIYRWRSAGGEVRQQIKWVLFSSLLMLMTLAVSLVNTILWEGFGIDLGLDKILPVAMNLSLLGLLAALGIAVLKYRLFDIDLIINRTLVYGALTLIIVLGYIFLVSGLGVLLPVEVGLVPSLIATGILAVLFAPISARLQRGANRLVYGERQQPYEVMRTLGTHLESASGPERVMPAIAETLARSLKFPYVSISLKRAGDITIAAEYGSRRQDAVDLPLYYQADLIGYLSLCPRDGETEVAEQDRELLHQIALWLGPVAHASTLARELRQSHTRLVAAQAEERRRLYRDLHDGLGPALASQTFRFDHALEMLPDNPEAVIKILHDLKKQTQGLVLEIRRLVYALRSSTLDELGLLGSLQEAIVGFQGSVDGLQIILEGDEQTLRQLPAAHEQAAERIALEALTNVVRHANADCCRIVLEIQTQPLPLLQIIVEDDGWGQQPVNSSGVGIASMIKRAESLGGSVQFERNRPHGTRVVARLPLPDSSHSSERR